MIKFKSKKPNRCNLCIFQYVRIKVRLQIFFQSNLSPHARKLKLHFRLTDYQFYKFQPSTCDLAENTLLELLRCEQTFDEHVKRQRTIQAACLMLCDQLRHTAVHFPSCLCHFTASDNSCCSDAVQYCCICSLSFGYW